MMKKAYVVLLIILEIIVGVLGVLVLAKVVFSMRKRPFH